MFRCDERRQPSEGAIGILVTQCDIEYERTVAFKYKIKTKIFEWQNCFLNDCYLWKLAAGCLHINPNPLE